MFRKYMVALWDGAEAEYRARLLRLIDIDPDADMVDLGCDDGEWTQRVAGAIGTSRMHGVEKVAERGELARQKGIDVTFSDLNDPFPFDDNRFSVVHSNQVIEHIQDLDEFVAQIYRILRPGGYALVCSENLASWHNVIPLFFGFQPFSLTNITKTGTIGNPWGVHTHDSRGEGAHKYPTWFHTRVLAYQAFLEIFQRHGFRVEVIGGTGYHPFPRFIARVLSRLDPRHSHFIYVKIRKPLMADT